jgi:hypothetical protein
MALSGAAFAGDYQQIAEICAEEMNLSANVCACIGAKADQDLNDDERRLLIAMLTHDGQTAAELRTTLPFESKTKAGMFMTRAPANCAEAMGDQE